MERAWVALALTLKVAGWATAINLFLGVGVGHALARWRFPGRDLLDAALTLPMVMPPTVLGYYLLVLIGSQGPLGAWLLQHFGIRLIFSWQAAVIAATVVAFPLVFKAARAAFEQVDPQLEDAARTLGISEAAVFFRVSLPLAWRGILAGLLLRRQDADAVDRGLRGRAGRPGRHRQLPGRDHLDHLHCRAAERRQAGAGSRGSAGLKGSR
jgi:molybdate transport system permease protein